MSWLLSMHCFPHQSFASVKENGEKNLDQKLCRFAEQTGKLLQVHCSAIPAVHRSEAICKIKP